MTLINGLIIFFLCASAHAKSGSLAPQSVIGDDNRVQISEGASTKYNAIGMLSIGKYRCTGTLIAPRVVLTAGHCITNNHHALIKPKEITFEPGKRKNGHRPLGQFKAIRVTTFNDYLLREDRDYDIALVELELAPKAVPMKISHSPDMIDLFSTRIFIAGYPGDKPYATLWEGNALGAFHSFIGNTLQYTVDTFSMQSGSAIRIMTRHGERIIGVHTTGKSNVNQGVRFNSTIMQALKSWMKPMLD